MNKENIRIECPFCAEFIRPNAKICRYCGKEITERNLIENGFTKQCPACYKVLKPNLENCFYCGIELFVCDDCNSYVLKEDKICPTCGTSFEDEKETTYGKYLIRRPKEEFKTYEYEDSVKEIMEIPTNIQKTETKVTID